MGLRIIHICAGWEETNGAANIARLIAGEQRAAGASVVCTRWASPRALRTADEVWIHCGWLPCLWWAALWGRRTIWLPEACYDPIRLAYHGWKKRLVGPVERFFLRRCVRLVATCAAEKDWIRSYLGPSCPSVEVTDIRRFFPPVATAAPLSMAKERGGRPLRVLYLGRRHPLKGLVYLERAVESLRAKGAAVELRLESAVFGAEKDAAFAWCDVFCLPTLSDNLGLVVAEALAQGRPVITTDGAPAWSDDPRVIFLVGYRAGTDSARMELLERALGSFL